MNDKPTVTTELARNMLELLQSGKDFVIAQAPDVVHQLLQYEYYSCVYYVVLFSIHILLGLLFWVAAYIVRDDDEAMMIGILFGIGLNGVGVLGIACNILDLVKISVAPKVFLIEYFSALIK